MNSKASLGPEDSAASRGVSSTSERQRAIEGEAPTRLCRLEGATRAPIMIGIDTNVLVRYLTQDDPVQAEQTNRFIEQALKKGETLFLNSIVLCELVWVLESAYNFEKQPIIDTLEKIIATTEFELENRDEIHLALNDFRNSNADFSDCLVGRKNRSAGCEETWSFDQTTKKLSHFKLMEE